MKAVLDIKKERVAKGITQEQLAELTGIPRGRINAWEQRGTVPRADDYEKVIEVLDFKKETNVSYSSTEEKKSIKILDVDFSAGFQKRIMDSHYSELGALSIPEVIGCDYIIRARGDSMVDYINDRDWIGIKEIKDRELIAYGNPYAIVTEDLNLIKIIKKSKQHNHILLHSKNQDYEDFDIEITKILSLYIIKIVLPFSKIKTFI